jgi:hypothetical protein
MIGFLFRRRLGGYVSGISIELLCVPSRRSYEKIAAVEPQF